MVRSKEELLQCSNAWVNQARNDIRTQIVNFLQVSGMTEAQLADILCITTNELASIIETNNDISLSTFSKLLIATDNVLEIKPLAESPMANQMPPRGHRPMPMNGQMPPRSHNGAGYTRPQNGAQMPPRGHRPMPNGGMMPPPIDPRTGRPLPPPPAGYPMPNGGMMPPMGGQMPPRFGGMPGMSRRMTTTQPQMNQPTVGGEQPLDTLASKSRNELVQMICDNYWDGEINCDEVSKTELINFLISKRQGGITPQRPVVAPQPQMEQPVNVENNEQPQFEGVAVPTDEVPEDESMVAFRQMLDEAVTRDPHLRDVIAQYRTHE